VRKGTGETGWGVVDPWRFGISGKEHHSAHVVGLENGRDRGKFGSNAKEYRRYVGGREKMDEDFAKKRWECLSGAAYLAPGHAWGDNVCSSAIREALRHWKSPRSRYLADLKPSKLVLVVLNTYIALGSSAGGGGWGDEDERWQWAALGNGP